MTKSESSIRAKAKRLGYRIEKSRQRESVDNLGHFMVVDTGSNVVKFGSRYDATLDDIANFLN